MDRGELRGDHPVLSTKTATAAAAAAAMAKTFTSFIEPLSVAGYGAIVSGCRATANASGRRTPADRRAGPPVMTPGTI
jgi:hypothetical protein